MTDDILNRPMFAQNYQIGGPVAPMGPPQGMPMGMPPGGMPPGDMPPPEGMPPEGAPNMQDEQMIAALVDMANEMDNLEGIMNVLRGDKKSVGERRDELAEIVGPEDAEKTPDTSLTIAQFGMKEIEKYNSLLAQGGAMPEGIGTLPPAEGALDMDQGALMGAGQPPMPEGPMPEPQTAAGGGLMIPRYAQGGIVSALPHFQDGGPAEAAYRRKQFGIPTTTTPGQGLRAPTLKDYYRSLGRKSLRYAGETGKWALRHPGRAALSLLNPVRKAKLGYLGAKALAKPFLKTATTYPVRTGAGAIGTIGAGTYLSGLGKGEEVGDVGEMLLPPGTKVSKDKTPIQNVESLPTNNPDVAGLYSGEGSIQATKDRRNIDFISQYEKEDPEGFNKMLMDTTSKNFKRNMAIINAITKPDANYMKQQAYLQLAQFGLNLAASRRGDLVGAIAESAKEPLAAVTALGAQERKDKKDLQKAVALQSIQHTQDIEKAILQKDLDVDKAKEIAEAVQPELVRSLKWAAKNNMTEQLFRALGQPDADTKLYAEMRVKMAAEGMDSLEIEAKIAESKTTRKLASAAETSYGKTQVVGEDSLKGLLKSVKSRDEGKSIFQLVKTNRADGIETIFALSGKHGGLSGLYVFNDKITSPDWKKLKDVEDMLVPLQNVLIQREKK